MLHCFLYKSVFLMQTAQNRTHPDTQVLWHAVPTCLQRHRQLWSWLRDAWIREEAKGRRHDHAVITGHNRFNMIKDTPEPALRSRTCASLLVHVLGQTFAHGQGATPGGRASATARW
jgi:hypothetical protein